MEPTAALLHGAAFANQMRGCSAHGWSGTHANDIDTQVNTYKYICATRSCTVLYVHWPRTETACAFALACQGSLPTEDSITPSHVDKICRPIVKENLLRCQNVICCSVKRSVLQHKTQAAQSCLCSHTLETLPVPVE